MFLLEDGKNRKITYTDMLSVIILGNLQKLILTLMNTKLCKFTHPPKLYSYMLI